MEEMIDSEKAAELRLCLKGVEFSAKDMVRPRDLGRRGDTLPRAEFFAFMML